MRPACSLHDRDHMAEVFNRLSMHLGPQSCPAEECPRRLRAGDSMFIKGSHGTTVQGMNEHFSPGAIGQLRQPAGVVHVPVCNEDSPNIVQRKGNVEFTSHRVNPVNDMLK